ncbi:hypothetical protein ACFO9Q_02205 [Paenibacillus sp. GCM10023252]|uniref:hypothetical protein n=1 Tax=Paenibacillus sp. GCM10023252 TaxID=3252649 RepID=UPI00361DD7C9
MAIVRMSEEAHSRAATYMKRNARVLEGALYAWEFEGGTAAQALSALAAYQNEDGGFGHGLEPDIQCADSTVITTTVALQHLSKLGMDDSSELVQGAIRYLLAEYDRKLPDGWEIVPAAVESAPHAPWWQYNSGHFGWGNPAIEIAGFFHEYEKLVPTAVLSRVMRDTVEYLLVKSSRSDMHELLCALRFAERVPSDVLEEVKPAIDEMVERCVLRDPSQWQDYGLLPLQAAPRPDSIYHARLRSSIEANLKHVLQEQGEDGAWQPIWSWGMHDEAWSRAKEDWKGVLTLHNLRILHAYGVAKVN